MLIDPAPCQAQSWDRIRDWRMQQLSAHYAREGLTGDQSMSRNSQSANERPVVVNGHAYPSCRVAADETGISDGSIRRACQREDGRGRHFTGIPGNRVAEFTARYA